MRDDLLLYYERELDYLRKMGMQFAAKNPKVASRLVLEPTKCEDPHVERILEATARKLAQHARIDVTDFEADLGITYTFATINYLIRRCPGVHFVWIMGADNLRSFHRWQRWRDIAHLVPIAVVDRLGPSLYSVASTAGQALAWARLPESAARSLPQRVPPAWIYLHGLKSPLSSTALRAARALGRHK